MKIVNVCNKIIEYSFYALFLLVPLVFSGSTSELFELNKMWLTYGITIIIGTSWATKMIAQKKIAIQRTPLDIPLMLFLVSQTISTIISLDSHVSFWGYYSRFNGGLLSTLSYILLYYAFVSNFPGFLHKLRETVKHKHYQLPNPSADVVRKVLVTSLIAGTGVALWGIPSHFGSDPTCLVFRGTFDTSCWTDAFKPTIRAFSTLGQPAWLAAYVAVLIPLALAFFLTKFTDKYPDNDFKYGASFALAIIFYLCLDFANTRAGFIAFVVADIIFWGAIFGKKLIDKQKLLRYFVIFHSIFLVCSFLFGLPFAALNKFTLPEIQHNMAAKQAAPAAGTETITPANVNITDSGDIRKIVWKGAIEAWMQNPLIGTGVETFAYAYYQYKPAAHNMTSEWDYLYNKAHNEYLNYLATTGILGLGTYLAIIIVFLITTIKILRQKDLSKSDALIILGLVAGYIALLVANFFGFSVVIINLYFFLIPAFVFVLAGVLQEDQTLAYDMTEDGRVSDDVNPYQWTIIVIVLIFALYLIIGLVRSWNADKNYALGSNYNQVGSYQQAYPLLLNAAQAMPGEPVYQDEFVTNLGTLATALYMNKDATNAAALAQQAIDLDDRLLAEHPNNVVFWKNRVRVFYALAQGDPENKDKYFTEGLKAMQQASKLAPNDAKISYNLAILYNENGQVDKAIETAKKTIAMKSDYRDAYVALGLFYHEKKQTKEAIGVYEEILKKINPGDKEVKETLEKWKKE